MNGSIPCAIAMAGRGGGHCTMPCASCRIWAGREVK